MALETHLPFAKARHSLRRRIAAGAGQRRICRAIRPVQQRVQYQASLACAIGLGGDGKSWQVEGCITFRSNSRAQR